MAQTARLAQLRQNLIEYFSDEELRTLCFDLGIDYDSMPGRSKADKARELLSDLDHCNRIPDLTRLCSILRPNVAWQEILTAIQAKPPFKGLQYFDQADADLFFGRELLTARFVGRLRQERLLAVVGASGSGKSSVVRAGLVPALKHGEPLMDGTLPPNGSTLWPIHVITPMAHPLKELATSLTRDAKSVKAAAMLMDYLAQDRRALDLAVSRMLKQTSQANRLLLVVDQFEELFTACKDEAERQIFIDNLLHAAAPETEGRTIVVITLRADFYAHCAQYANLREALEKHQAYIGPMTADELRRAIEEPARRNGWEFEPGLVDLLLRDVGEEPGALPLLSHALFETWNRRKGRTLTLAGYDESGGVQGAIAKTADAVLSEMKPEEQAVARSIFLRLTQLGEGTQDTRRRAGLDELVLRPQDKTTVEAVLKTLVDTRLVITGEAAAEVSHEALIREWPTLRHWLDEDREGLRLLRQLTEHAQEWLRLNRDEGSLYRGLQLAQVENWLEKHPSDLSQLENEFVQSSVSLRERERAERHRERAARERLRRLITRVAVAAAIVCLILAGVTAFQWRAAEEQRQVADQQRRYAEDQQSEANAQRQLAEQQRQVAEANRQQAEQQRQQADQQRQLALARQLAAQAQGGWNNTGTGAIQSMLLAIESMRRLPAWNGDQALRRGLGLLPKPVTQLTHQDNVSAVAFGSLGQYVVTGSKDGTARVWNVSTGQEVARLDHTSNVTAVAFSPDGQWVASASEDGALVVWDATTGKPISRMKHEGAVTSVVFSADGKWVASSSYDNTGRIWEAATGKQKVLVEHAGPVMRIAFNADATLIATASQDKTACVWETGKGGQVSITKHNGPVNALAFSPTPPSGVGGKWVASGSDDKTARVWEAATGREIARMTHEGQVLALAFSPDGKWVASGSDVRISFGIGDVAISNGQVRIWEAATGKARAQIVLPGWVHALSFSPDGQQIVSASEDGTARVWEAATGRELARLANERPVRAVAISPDGRLVAVAGDQVAAQVWEATAQQEVARFTHAWPAVMAAAFSPDGQIVMSGSGRPTGPQAEFRAWHVASGRGLAPVSQDVNAVAAAFSRDGKWMAAETRNGTTLVFDLQTILVTGQFKHEQLAFAVSFSPDSKWVASGRQDGLVQIWERATGKELARWKQAASVWGLAFSQDGQWLASGTDDGTIQVWEIGTGKQVAQFAHTRWVAALAFSSDGKWLASGSFDGTARLWNVRTGEQTMRFVHEDAVRSVALSSDGKWLLTGCNDGTVRVWDIATGIEMARMMHDNYVNAVSFSPDEQWILSAGWDSTARVWRWKPEDLIREGCARLTRNLTLEEWQTYLPGEPYRKTCPDLPVGQ